MKSVRRAAPMMPVVGERPKTPERRCGQTLMSDALAAIGWSSTRIEKVLGASLVRLYAETWGG
jgi:hypothetical protein